MAPTSPGRSAVPSLNPELLGESRRLVVTITAGDAALDIARRASETSGLGLVVTGVVGARPVAEPIPGDLLIHGVPDVFGRLLPIPAGWSTVVVRDRTVATVALVDVAVIEVGDASPHEPWLLAGALASLFKPLCQQGGVRPIFAEAPPMGLPFIAPDGVDLPTGFGRIDWPTVAGLPDLAVVRPVGEPPSGTRRLAIRWSAHETEDR